jgi:hypothetical protein
MTLGLGRQDFFKEVRHLSVRPGPRTTRVLLYWLGNSNIDFSQI